ncbi:MAG: acyl-CoA dehydrogenase family protein [Kiritimatiellia bacterium]|jgi:alkylation response protein AidB-like acyl-CoA dehydrogenase|nr:acyl-CoA dehydrogenase family protein [Pseudomonadales bacterium]MDP6469392.1 acyl-CoA dehydrogenase family protein [Pseudomonadales bacterium]MDP6828990.1 acyl-CoA dehydrogenase family protein [Pseudomonadales bacterium]MDP7024697.1 acyl-CoA dehydrogenase family protein [Kiritimatiellia bacterium]|tara:strand:+ start:2965 stop:4101 length:1137 start_codon:yes stop_codon:yes gene_type:complete
MAVLTEEQSMLKDQAQAWSRDESPVAKFRQMRDSGVAMGFDDATWSDIAAMGWTGILIPEELGGSGMDHATFGVVLEEMGRQLVASPLFASSLVGASALLLGGTDAQRQRWLPGVAAGDAIVTLAVDEGPHHRPEGIALQVERSIDGFTLTGSKTFVLEGGSADAFVVAARTSGEPGDKAGITLFLIPSDADGISVTSLKMADSRGYADLTFSNVKAGTDTVLGEVDNAFDLLDALLDRARAGLAAEMLGTACEAFDRTLVYLKTREQFGQVIGSFQSLGHRAATLFMDMEFARSCVEAALRAIDDGSDEVPILCSLAKCKAGEFLHDMSNDMIQMHGGIGMTDEFDAGFFLKRARAAEAAFGGQSFHRRRYISHFGI